MAVQENSVTTLNLPNVRILFQLKALNGGNRKTKKKSTDYIGKDLELMLMCGWDL